MNMLANYSINYYSRLVPELKPFSKQEQREVINKATWKRFKRDRIPIAFLLFVASLVVLWAPLHLFAAGIGRIIHAMPLSEAFVITGKWIDASKLDEAPNPQDAELITAFKSKADAYLESVASFQENYRAVKLSALFPRVVGLISFPYLLTNPDRYLMIYFIRQVIAERNSGSGTRQEGPNSCNVIVN